jgi:hypothetical protein
MSVLNISALCSFQLGAGLTYLLGVTESNFDNLWLLVLVANLTSLLPLPLLKWLPDEKNSKPEEDPPQSPMLTEEALNL